MSPELIIDSFAGGGGASTGIEIALGRSPDVAINHDANALALHRANHPETIHLTTDIWGVDPATVAAGRKIGLLWASPTCTHFSKAKGGAPVRLTLDAQGRACGNSVCPPLAAALVAANCPDMAVERDEAAA